MVAALPPPPSLLKSVSHRWRSFSSTSGQHFKDHCARAIFSPAVFNGGLVTLFPALSLFFGESVLFFLLEFQEFFLFSPQAWERNVLFLRGKRLPPFFRSSNCFFPVHVMRSAPFRKGFARFVPFSPFFLSGRFDGGRYVISKHVPTPRTKPPYMKAVACSSFVCPYFPKHTFSPSFPLLTMSYPSFSFPQAGDRTKCFLAKLLAIPSILDCYSPSKKPPFFFFSARSSSPPFFFFGRDFDDPLRRGAFSLLPKMQPSFFWTPRKRRLFPSSRRGILFQDLGFRRFLF